MSCWNNFGAQGKLGNRHHPYYHPPPLVFAGSHVFPVTAVLVIGTEGCQLGTPSFMALVRPPARLLPPTSLRYFGILGPLLQPCVFALVYYGADVRGAMNSVACVRVRVASVSVSVPARVPVCGVAAHAQ